MLFENNKKNKMENLQKDETKFSVAPRAKVLLFNLFYCSTPLEF